MVEGEGVLESVSGEVACVPVAAGVVDQYVDAWMTLEYLGGQSPHLLLGGQVGDERVDVVTARCPDLASRVFGTRRVSPGNQNVCPHRGQTKCGRFADPSRTTG